MGETVEMVGGNVESLKDYRELKAEAPVKVAELLENADFERLSPKQRIEVLEALLKEYSLIDKENPRPNHPLHNEHRHIASELRKRLDIEEGRTVNGRNAVSLAA